MNVMILNTLATVHKLFGKTADEVCKQFGMRNVYGTANPWGVHTSNSTTGDGKCITIGFKGYTDFISFCVDFYPSCCGSKLFHTFKVDEHRVTQDQLNEIMGVFFAENQHIFSSSRLEVVMVEQRFNKNGYSAYGREPLAEPEPIENPSIVYKSLWNFFHTKTRRVRTRLEVNGNTGNILHNMEVIL